MGFDCDRHQTEKLLCLFERLVVVLEKSVDQSKVIRDLTAQLKTHTDALNAVKSPQT